jgi:hypothetical protein
MMNEERYMLDILQYCAYHGIVLLYAPLPYIASCFYFSSMLSCSGLLSVVCPWYSHISDEFVCSCWVFSHTPSTLNIYVLYCFCLLGL